MKVWLRGLAIIFLLAIPAWLLLILPQTPKYSDNFRYSVDVISLDNFYDETTKTHLGSQISKTKFYYETVGEEEGVLTIRNVFDVRTMNDKPIFAVDRVYGIDAADGRHVKGHGDKDRSGYLMAPKKVSKVDYIYWHINYDEPATMIFKAEEEIYGLHVYRFEANYYADQTGDLGFLPGVPEERGVDLDINLQIWIEPISGHMVKYKDDAICYYYDIKTKERIHPWNKFSNKYSTTSIKNQVAMAKKLKQQIILKERFIPIVFLIAALLLLGIAHVPKREHT